MSQVVPRLAPRFGTARLLVGGLVIDLVGLAWLSRTSATTPTFPASPLPLLLVGGRGRDRVHHPYGAGDRGVADEDAGAASGLVNVFHQVGGCLGIAVMTTIFVSATRVPGQVPASHVLAHGVSSAFTGSTVSMGLALVVTLLTIGRADAAALEDGVDMDVADAMAA